MGYDFTKGATRAAIIERITAGWTRDKTTSTCLAHELKLEFDTTVLWTVEEQVGPDEGQTKRFIGCYLLAEHVEIGQPWGWGHKDISESMGPCYYSVPLNFLDMVPVANERWRGMVRETQADWEKTAELKETE